MDKDRIFKFELTWDEYISLCVALRTDMHLLPEEARKETIALIGKLDKQVANQFWNHAPANP